MMVLISACHGHCSSISAQEAKHSGLLLVSVGLLQRENRSAREAELISQTKKKGILLCQLAQLYKPCSVLWEYYLVVFLPCRFLTCLKVSVFPSPWSQHICWSLLHMSSTSLLQQLSVGFLFSFGQFVSIFQADRLWACSERFSFKYEVAKSLLTELEHEKMVHLPIQNCKQAFAFKAMSFCGLFLTCSLSTVKCLGIEKGI